MNEGFTSRPKPNGGDPKRDDFLPDLSSEAHPNGRPGTLHGGDDSTPEPEQPPVRDEPENIAQQDETKPEETEAERPVDESIELDNTGAVPLLGAGKPKKPRWWHKIGPWFKGLNKKQKALVIAAVVLVVAGSSAGVYALFFSDAPKPAPQATAPPPPPEPTTVPNTLTGRQVEPEINERQVTAVMIENSLEARPQAGLQEAGVVFEAIAEGGITRFLALYQDTSPESIGPVRSLRPYYLSWAQGFDAAIAHVGGSPEALQQVRDRGTKDLDQFAHASYYQRVTDRYAPHNMFTSIAQLRKLQDSLNYNSSNFTGFARHEEGEPADKPNATKIQVNVSSHNYNSAYTYDKKTDAYARTMGGEAHKDKNTDKQVKPDVVVVMVANYGIHSDGQHSVYDTVGNGKVYVFQNGRVEQGTWSKSSHTSNISFSDKQGNPLKLNPGQTWITAVSSADKVSYQGPPKPKPAN